LSALQPAFAEEDATMHQVYLAAEAGKFDEAQSMMDKVLSDHPNSAKAHFVEAELLAKQGLFSNAGVELNTAESLQPGLPFAKPQVLLNLRSRIASASNGAMQSNMVSQNTTSNVKNRQPSILLLLGIGLILILIGYMSRRNSWVTPANIYSGNAPRPKHGTFRCKWNQRSNGATGSWRNRLWHYGESCNRGGHGCWSSGR